MVKRIITAIVIIICVIPPILLGGYLLDLLVALIMVVGGFELTNLLTSRKNMSNIAIFLCYLGTAFAVLGPTKYGIGIFAILVLILLAVPIFHHKFGSDDAFHMIAFVGLLYLFGSAFMRIYDYNKLYVWYILLATYGCDTGAYFIGSIFGKTKLIPSISPKKTVEGAVGGWFVGALLSLLFALFIIKDMNGLLLILGCIWLPIISQIGDLSFSAIKRYFNIKDFSNIFPGHGGFMDRIDSLVFNLISFSVLMVLVL